jgi:nucleoside-diphosphate-sugar epimerase
MERPEAAGPINGGCYETDDGQHGEKQEGERALRALVTGCAGFVGSQLSETLLEAGWSVRGVDSFTDYYDPEIKRRNLLGALAARRFELAEADLRQTDIAALLDDVDVVYHLAGQPGVRVSWSDGFPVYVGQNVLSTQRLLEAIRLVPVSRLVYASSSSVYGNAAKYPVSEQDTPQPFSPYGVTKLAAEHLCSLYAANWKMPTASLRYFTVYGPRQRPDMGFARFFTAAAVDEPLPIYGSGKQVRDFTYVSDVVAATMAAGTADLAPGTICNVSGGTSISIAELIPLFGEIMGKNIAIQHLEEQPGDVQRTGGSVERAKSLLGWTPEVSLRDGLAAQFAWWRGR